MLPKHSVELITERDEQRGITKGIIINKPISNVNVMTDKSSYNVDLSLKLALANSPVAIGGPVNVDKSEYTILHGQASSDCNNRRSMIEDADGFEIQQELLPGVYIGGYNNLKRQSRLGNKPEVLFVKGHVEWNSDDLQNEIHEFGKWHVVATCSNYLLRHVGSNGGYNSNDDQNNDLWSDIMNHIR
jgi:putative AlgH/UPF0301 family transcriptional regulator